MSVQARTSLSESDTAVAIRIAAMTPTIATHSVVLSACFVSSCVRLAGACLRVRSAVSVAAIWCLLRGSITAEDSDPLPSQTTVTRYRQDQKNCSDRSAQEDRSGHLFD